MMLNLAELYEYEGLCWDQYCSSYLSTTFINLLIVQGVPNSRFLSQVCN